MTATRKQADSRKVRNDTQEEIATIKQWVNVVRREKGLLVVEVYTDWAGPCDPMVRYMKRAKFDLPKEHQEMVKCYVLSADDVPTIFEAKRGIARPFYLFFAARGRLVDVHPPLNRPPIVNPIVMGEQIKKWTDLAAKYELGSLDAAGRSSRDNLDFYFPLLKNDAVLNIYKIRAEEAYVAEEAINAKEAEIAAAAAARKSAAGAGGDDGEEEMGDDEAEAMVRELEEMRANAAAAAATQSTAALVAASEREDAEADQKRLAEAETLSGPGAGAPLLGVMPMGADGENAGGEVTNANAPAAPDGSSLAEPIVSDNTQPMGEANKVVMSAPDAAGGAGGGTHHLAMPSTFEDHDRRAKSIERQDTITITYHKKTHPVQPTDAREAIQPGAANLQDTSQIQQAIDQKRIITPPDGVSGGSTPTPDGATPDGPPDGRGELFHPTELVRPNEPVNPAAQSAEAGNSTLPSSLTSADVQHQIQRAAEQDDADAAVSQSVPYDVEHTHARAELAARLANPVIDANVFDPASALAQEVKDVKQSRNGEQPMSTSSAIDNQPEQPLAGFSNVDPFKIQASIEQDAHGFYDAVS